jgi:hypothetical protein
MRLFGDSFQTSIVILAQCLLASATLVILFRFLCMISHQTHTQLNILGVIIFGLSPTYMKITFQPYSEILFLFFYALFVYFLLISYKSSDFKKENFKKKLIIISSSAVCGLTLGMTTLTRPVSQLLIILVLGLLLSQKKYLQGLVITGTFLLTIIPWLARNYTISHTLTISNIASYNFLNHAAKPLITNEELKEYQKKIPPIPRVNIQRTSAAGIGYYGHDDAKNDKQLTIMILKDKWKLYLFKITKNLLDFPITRGSNILSSIFTIDYKYYRSLPLKEKMKDIKYMLIIFGAVYDFIHRVLFFSFVLMGIILVFLKYKNTKDVYFLIFLISFYFLLVTSAIMLDDFELKRMILPAYLGLTAFVPISIKKLIALRNKQA